jgi:DNA-binding response OmpR family regulator
MREVFEKKSGKIIVIEGSGAARTLLTETLRSVGFTDIVGVPEVKDAVGIMESEKVGWIITSLFPEKPENGLQLVKLITENRFLKQVRISFLLDENEKYVIPAAFELGTLSWHKKPFTKDSLLSEWNALLDHARDYDYSSTLVAAHYLREDLRHRDCFVEQLSFEKEIIKVFPANPALFLNMVEPMVQMGNKDGAKSVLQLVASIAPGLDARISKLQEEFLKDEKLDDAVNPEAMFNFLGLGRVVLVDSDETVHTQVREIMSSIGCKELRCFSDGLEAQEFVEKNPELDLIIQEWRIRKVTGPIFLQRIKAVGAITTPVIVASSLLQKDDLPFIREMGVSSMIYKPIEKDKFVQTLTWTMQQERIPTDQAVLERKIRTYLARKDFENALALNQKYQADPKIPAPAKTLIQAEFAFARNEFKAAKTLALEALKFAGDSIFALNLLGKILLSLREYQLALVCFEKAQKIAPQNVERICTIAEINAEMGDDDKAREAVEKACELDKDSARVQETQAKVAIHGNDTKAAKKYLTGLMAIEKVVAAMNNSAVALVNSDRTDDGLAKYHSTLDSIPDDRVDIQALVLYNIGLAFAKDAQLENAIEALDKCLKITDSKVYGKAVSLKKRVLKALENGQPVHLRSSQPGAQGSDAEGKGGNGGAAVEGDEVVNVEQVTAAIEATLDAKKGDIGCYMIYKAPQRDAKISKLLQKSLRYTPRDSIERGTTYGADRVMASKAAG